MATSCVRCWSNFPPLRPEFLRLGAVGMALASVLAGSSRKENAMLYYAAVFFIIAIIAAVFGFTGIAVGAASIAKILFLIFLVLFAVSLVMGLLRRET